MEKEINGKSEEIIESLSSEEFEEAKVRGSLTCDKFCDVENAGTVYKLTDSRTGKSCYAYSNEVELFSAIFSTSEEAIQKSLEYYKQLEG